MSWISKILRRGENEPRSVGFDASEQTVVRAGKSETTVTADNPIRKAEDDVLGRAKPARSFADQVLSLDATEGVVVGILGPWGSGKTSFVNLARAPLEDTGVVVLDFNPWMFSGAEQLIESFFVEISAQLRLHTGLADIGKLLEDYGETFSGLGWLPLVGPWIERGRAATKILAKILQRRKEGIRARRTKVEKALAVLDKPIVVVLDDIDRLTTSEIRDIFKLVRLTANFPNVIYVLAFDRSRVEQALAEQGIPGRDYLEKILQLGIDLPAVPAQVLNSQIFRAIDNVLAKVDNPGSFDQGAWPDIFTEIIRPLLRNMRDVRRYAAAIHGTVRDLGGQIALGDVLALEAVRVFLPEVFRHMHESIGGLTTTYEFGYGREERPYLKDQIDLLVKTAGEHGDIVRALVQRLFPAGQRHVGGSNYTGDWKNRWLRERRVAHEEIFRLYLERVIGEGLQAFTYAEQAWIRMTDRGAFDSYLRSLDAERLQDVISSLEAYEDQFTSEHVVPAIIVLLNLLPELPERQLGMFDFADSRTVVGRVIYRLVRALKEPDAVEKAVSEILPKVNTLSSKLELITDIGFREQAGHKLVSEAVAATFEKAWRAEVRSADANTLAQEKELLKTLILAKREADPTEPPVEIDPSPRVTLAVLRSARSESRSQSMGSRAIRRTPRLAWAALVELYGDERILRERIESLKASKPEGIGDLLQLADKYLWGWRPKDFGED